MTQEKIQRINELYRKSQAEGLSDAEKKEQDLLRKEYIANVKKNLRNQLNNIDMVNNDGSVENLGEKYGNKKEIRSRLKKQRSLLGADECYNMSHEIYKRLMVSELDRDYDNILLYSAIRNEVNTDEYFAYLINKAKRIYYPMVSGDKMSFYRVRSLDELNCGSFNIKEPDMTKEYTQADGRALMIVPGLAFSDTGYRIGYGKGFYDRYLSSFTKRDTVMAVGVGYDFQLLSGMTFEDEYDVPLDGVITDKREVFIDE